MANYDGGYYLIREQLVRSGIHKHTSALDNPLSDETLSAVNAVQATRWRINDWVLDVMREAWVNGDLVGDIPDANTKTLPARLSDAQWKALSAADRSEYKHRLAEVHAENARTESARLAFLDMLSVAEELRDRDAIYFPHFVDFRGRIYPMVSTTLSPQGNDIARGLLMFADGKALGQRGLYWLAVRLANTYGMDKLAFEDRVKWVADHSEAIEDSGINPLDGARFWCEAEEPWSFLATCREYAMAMQGDPTEFVSHLPIPLDGTCNGLQHLSAMGRDPVGARATNLTNSGARQDIYEEVAAVVKRMVTEDAVNGVAEAHAWVGKVNRKTVKRAVMTTPYGVTNRGIREQLINDGHTTEADGIGKGPAAEYMKDKIVEALSQTVTSAKEIMAWLQAVAATMAKDQIAFEWTTPCGNRIRQSYHTLAREMVRTLVGDFILWEENPVMGLNGRKQMLASAPNVVHSFDAAHLVKTVNACGELDVQSFAMIHDSYGTHAADTDTMARVLREQFVAIYEVDWLERIEAEARAQAPLVDLPPRPQLGTFDVSEVLGAAFFFG